MRTTSIKKRMDRSKEFDRVEMGSIADNQVSTGISRSATKRVLFGSLLIVGAVFGLSWSFSNQSGISTVLMVVPKRTISPYQPISVNDLSTIRVPTRSQFSALFVSNSNSLLGDQALVALEPNEPITQSEVAPIIQNADRELTLEVPSARAVEGSLSPGDRVDVLATYGSGPTANTITAGRSVLVLAVSQLASSFSSSSPKTVSVTLAISSFDEMMAIAQGQVAATITLVRSTGAAPLPAQDVIYPPTAVNLSQVGSGSVANLATPSGSTQGQVG